jgi:8-oxo-dGTP pyrophosphatase MutT (NUDIX family)
MTRSLPRQDVVTCFLECDGCILILRRSDKVGSYQGKWAGVSGYMEAAADEQALVEIEEETGLSRSKVELVHQGEPLLVEGENVVWRVHPFLFRIKDRGYIRTDWEHTEHRWIKPSELGDYEAVPMLKEVLASVLER